MISEVAKRPTSEAAPIAVLIVDNDVPHAEAVAESLERVGYVPTIATSGPEGLQKLEQGAFDLVITDLIMNEVDGLQILSRSY